MGHLGYEGCANCESVFKEEKRNKIGRNIGWTLTCNENKSCYYGTKTNDLIKCKYYERYK